MSLKRFIQSFGFAIKGLKTVWQQELNFKIQVVSALLVTALGFVLDIRPVEWLVQCLVIALVLSLELLNTSIESLCDHLHPDIHPQIARVKDLAAAAVFVASLGALCVAAIIYVPKVLQIV